MPAAKPPEFRRRALDLVAQGEPVAQVARNLGNQRVVPAPLEEPDRRRCRPGRGPDQRGEAGAGRAAPQEPGPRDRGRDLEARVGVLRAGERAPKIAFRLVFELAADGISVAWPAGC